MGVKVFEDLDPVYLNFEDPADMMRKQQLVEQEMQRRAGQLPGQQVAPGQPGVVAQQAPNGQVAPGQQLPGQQLVPGQQPIAGSPVQGLPATPGQSLPQQDGTPVQAQLPGASNPPQLK